jgi:hypothetical protein
LLGRSLLSLSEEVFGVDIALPIEPEPLGRTTALHVLHTSTTVLAALNSADAHEIDWVVQHQADSCRALADLGDFPFRLDFRWSQRLPRPDDAVGFPDGAGRRLRAAGRKPNVEGHGVVEGPVTSLSDDEQGQRWRIGVRGVLHVDDVATGRQRVVPVLLGNAQRYELALTAHREGRVVRAEGAVTANGRGITAGDQGFSVTDRTSP